MIALCHEIGNKPLINLVIQYLRKQPLPARTVTQSPRFWASPLPPPRLMGMSNTAELIPSLSAG